ncbi:MAG: hypothetical protein H7Y14_12385 [Burkholderiales bacterium]|nr:hypothetical protein [Burkholderiales bacterium]
MALTALLLAGCANVQPVLAPTAAVDPASAYLAGTFTRMKGRGFAFVVRPVGQEVEYMMSLGEDTNLPTAVTDQTVAIKLPPGTYTVAQWVTYNPLSKEITTRRAITNSVLNQPFTVKGGTVVHLGRYDVSQYNQREGLNTMIHFRVQPRVGTTAEMQAALARAYPNLAARPFQCVLCTR